MTVRAKQNSTVASEITAAAAEAGGRLTESAQ